MNLIADFLGGIITFFTNIFNSIGEAIGNFFSFIGNLLKYGLLTIGGIALLVLLYHYVLKPLFFIIMKEGFSWYQDKKHYIKVKRKEYPWSKKNSGELWEEEQKKRRMLIQAEKDRKRRQDLIKAKELKKQSEEDELIKKYIK